jgi:GNAT superfamily N-acetyltransferase
MIIEPCDDVDLPQVFELYRRTMSFPPHDALERYWAWKIVANPARRANVPTAYVAREGGAVIGSIAQIPVLLDVAGRTVPVTWAVDLIVHPRAQGRGVGKALFAHQRQENRVAISMGYAPDSVTSRVARTAGFQGFPSLRYVFKLLTTKLLANRLPFGGLLGRIPLGALGRLRRPSAGSLRCEPLTSFPPSFDELWQSVAAETRIAVRRDHATMRWRYLDNPFDRYRVLGVWDGAALAGCLVFKVVRSDALTYGTIAEIVAPAAAVTVQQTLVAWALEELARARVDVVKTLASAPHLDALLRRAGFCALGKRCDFVIGVAPGARVDVGESLDPATWYLTKGDCDLDMVPDFMTHVGARRT